jgi:hypothetical protein
MIHDLYLRAYTTFNEKAEEPEEKQPRGRKGAAKQWPDYALVWDTESSIWGSGLILVSGGFANCEAQNTWPSKRESSITTD